MKGENVGEGGLEPSKEPHTQKNYSVLKTLSKTSLTPNDQLDVLDEVPNYPERDDYLR
ncbi:MAG: hypothetical protein U5L04_03750 [Trueperaceae bacterium]|nr:hypothetical protein [Trueperaceae bacterium]